MEGTRVKIGQITTNYVRTEDDARIVRSDKKAQISSKLAREEQSQARIKADGILNETERTMFAAGLAYCRLNTFFHIFE